MVSKRLTANVSGVVQGVFFRAHTKAVAEKFGLKGYVRNLPDGRVEVVAEGSEGMLRKLLEWLRKGPGSARVEGCEASIGPAKGGFSSFEVKLCRRG